MNWSDLYSSSSNRSRKPSKLPTTRGATSSASSSSSTGKAAASSSRMTSGLDVTTCNSLVMLLKQLRHMSTGIWVWRLGLISNCAEVRCTSTCANLMGFFVNAVSCWSCWICSLRSVPLLPRPAIISFSFESTASSVSSTLSAVATCFWRAGSSSSLPLRTFCTLGFSGALTAGLAEEEVSFLIHLALPVAFLLSSLSEEELSSSSSSDQSSSSSSSSASLAGFLANLEGTAAAAGFLATTSSSESDDSDASAAEASLSASGLARYLAISASYCLLCLRRRCFMAFNALALVDFIFLTSSLLAAVAFMWSSRLQRILMKNRGIPSLLMMACAFCTCFWSFSKSAKIIPQSLIFMWLRVALMVECISS
mmetsp:Transcript_7586/g.17404  ORF Transcript_7586/g.17404 Transcript_7586/m.17404 type:complete len:367 (+) Transcript_7586:1414-2514(+)